ncbi:MAG: thioredoxin-disulfide reductase, partial [Firmicutes bacterium]|nr:thioredoxin-disulfide reductase [Bacillota bacterium]
ALYGARSSLSVLLIEQMAAGGQMGTSFKVDNYPGFPEGVEGVELGQKMESQALKFGAEIIMATVTGFAIEGKEKRVLTSQGIYRGKTVILAPGTYANTLGIPGEKELLGRGVSYCAICDGAFFKNKVVAVIGGGDAAVEEALFLTRFASKVIIIHRRDQLRAVKNLQDSALTNPKIEICWDTIPLKISGDKKVDGVKVKNVKTDKEDIIACAGIFLYVGRVPSTSFLSGSGINLDERGYIITDNHLRTNLSGVFAAGDVRQTPLRQVVTAAADGALAATEIGRMLEQ